MITETNKKHVCDHGKVLHNCVGDVVEDRVNECKFVYLKNDALILMGGKINLGHFQFLLNDINEENIAKLRLLYVRRFNFVCLVTPKQGIFV